MNTTTTPATLTSATSWHHAKLHWNDKQPFSAEYQDIYFSTDNGLQETEYVFLQGNDLASRWQSANTQNFTIIETGFGTGLNFLCAAGLWLKNNSRQATLHFISVEKHPLTEEDMTAALDLWPELKDLSAPLLTQYPALINGQTIALYDHSIKLTLLIGDATEQFGQIDNQADAWFLDGFSPAKNPSMWHPPLFEQMARLSHSQTTFATFTSAGIVRRGLTAAGFDVNKRAGFGKKREMIYGTFEGNSTSKENNTANDNDT